MERKFKIGDKVIPALNTSWVNDAKYRTVINIFKKGYRLTETETEGIHGAIWRDDELELYKEGKKEKKTYNLIEALKLPVGTKFKITYLDGSENTGYLGKYGLKEGENNVLLIGSLKEEARVTGHLANATYTVIEDKPLSFFEAVEQANGKKFRIEHEQYNLNWKHSLQKHMNNLSTYEEEIIKDIMLNAKCYLED